MYTMMSTYLSSFHFKHTNIDTNNSQFEYSLIITMNDSGLIIKITLQKLVKVTQRSSVSNRYDHLNVSKLGFLKAKINRAEFLGVQTLDLIPKVTATHNAFFLFSWHMVFR